MKSMPRLIVGRSDRNMDLRYACAFRTPSDDVVFLKHREKDWLVAPLMEREHAAAALQPSGGRVYTPADLGLRPMDRRRLSAWAYGLVRILGIKQVAVAPDFPLAIAEALRRRRIRVHGVGGALFPEREFKNAREIQACTTSQRAAVAALRNAVALIRGATIDAHGGLLHNGKRLTSETVRERIDTILFRHQCTATDTIVSCGADSALPHHRGNGPLRAGQPIVIDIFPQHRRHGYHGDLTRTLVRGPMPARLAAIMTAVRTAQRAALAKVRAGVAASTVHQAAVGTFARMGMTTDIRTAPPSGFIHSTGHGIGLDVHEAPTLGAGNNRLRAGQVVTVEPGWYEPGFGGVRIEDTVTVTRDGYKFLARCPQWSQAL